jgi:hypothetical protein
MNNIDTSGPAFPDGSTNEWGNATRGGMTLRDYFAAKAMQACFVDDTNVHGTATLAYRIADAMLEARGEK